MRTIYHRRGSVAWSAFFGLMPCASPDIYAGEEIQRIAVKSTVISIVGYSKTDKVLEIEMRAGAVYRYRSVPANVFDEMMAAESKGQYFSHNIRGRYPYEKLRPARK